MTIMIATPHGGQIDPTWLDCFLRLGKPVNPDHSPAWFRGAVVRTEIATARNMLVGMLLDPTRGSVRGGTDAQKKAAAQGVSHILFWDDDVYPPHDALIKLLRHKVPIVSGLYYTRTAPSYPVAYMKEDGRYRHVADDSDGLKEVDGVGCGFLLVAREVFEKLSSPWFQFIQRGDPNDMLSEDLFFCELAQAAGYPILMDFSVKCGHAGRYIFDEQDYVAERFDDPDLAALAPVAQTAPRPFVRPAAKKPAAKAPARKRAKAKR